ncbi:YqaA family protein [Aestuariibacter salexigens]|uniref:YqaA family protein n=1 Tax=Aestuariibacter salexigens TaxID=226010 RepID=UPI00042A2498|nr:YqaA family protein [Aestuariibacter salexigens]
MKIFQYCYDLALKWARHRHAPSYLAGLSFSESMFFPIPPDVMLAPMSLAQPNKAWRFALITTVASVLGGIAGYLLGWFAFDTLIQPWVESMGYQAKLERAVEWFDIYGVWVVFIAGFSPIPYKIFTISAGFLHMAFLPFLIASAIGRGMRFYLVAGLMKWGGPSMEQKLRDYVEYIGWLVVALAIIAYFVLR